MTAICRKNVIESFATATEPSPGLDLPWRLYTCGRAIPASDA